MFMRIGVKQFAKALAWKAGYDIGQARFSETAHALTLKLAALSKATVFLDIGANEGQFATGLLTYLPDARIISFEPSKQAHATAQQQSLRYANWTVAERVAVGASSGTVELNIAGNSVSSSVLPIARLHSDAAPGSQYTETESCRCEPLDNLVLKFIGSQDSLFMKIDTQGYEMHVLQGATLTLKRTVAIQTEVSFVELYKGQPMAKDIIDYLEYRNFSIVGFSNGLRHPITHKLLQADIYFIRDKLTGVSSP